MDFNIKPSKRIQIITLGNSEVGKTCIIKRLCEKRFVSKYIPTIGVDYGANRLFSSNNEAVQLNIFDLAGNPIFYEIRNEFYNNIHGVLLVYDISNQKSFESLNFWLSELLQILDCERENVACIVCGNKCDKKREINEHEGQLWAEYHGFPYFETSALTGEGIPEMFQFFIDNMLHILKEGKPLVYGSRLGYSREQLEAIHRLQWSKNNYERLGLIQGASKEEINRAYRRIAILIHPDKTTIPASEEAFKTLVTTRSLLLRQAK
ncbi:dnaJ homolog subfamily C member 27-like [Centruroides sculpturatus]|uniref:dnaJ homolog subfamily C member 27-like n=1 Tax=Centruroides sculpturatus TaxID=218467 RepID=UPI000C6E6371|nr:dnaJ homolog subfamily C member 27-like [Centruroides sculpturatus]